MHPNLEKRFIHLIAAEGSYRMKLEAFRIRFHLLFAAMAEQLGVTPEKLGRMMGWEPVPNGGNAIMRGEAEPSDQDIARLCDLYADGPTKALSKGCLKPERS